MNSSTINHFELWGKRLVIISFFDLVNKYGDHTTVIPARVLYEKSKEHRDSGAQGRNRPCTPPPPEQIFGLPLFKLSALELRFVHASLRAVSEYFQEKGVQLQHHSNLLVFCSASKDCGKKKLKVESSSFLDQEALKPWFEELSESFDTEQAFHYEDIVEPLVRANSALVSALVSSVFPHPAQVKIMQNVPIGGFMIPYDFCFETDPANQRISYPNYNILSDEHRDHFFALPELQSFRHRRHVQYLFKCVTIPSHEIIHVYQGVAKQKDPSSFGWSAEHDASVPAMSVLYHVAQLASVLSNKEKEGGSGVAAKEGNEDSAPYIELIQAVFAAEKGNQPHSSKEGEEAAPSTAEVFQDKELWSSVASILGNGVWEAAMLDFLRELRDLQQLLTPNEMEEYVKIKNAFGTYQPKIGTPIVAQAFKSLLPYEYFSPHLGAAKTLLELVFLNRIGVDTSLPESKPPSIPEECAHAKGWFFQRPAPVKYLAAVLGTVPSSDLEYK